MKDSLDCKTDLLVSMRGLLVYKTDLLASKLDWLVSKLEMLASTTVASILFDLSHRHWVTAAHRRVIQEP